VIKNGIKLNYAEHGQIFFKRHTFAEPVGFSLLVAFINIRTLPFRVGTFKHNAVLVANSKNCQDFRFDVPAR
jgi:hypothetical protein